MITKNEIDNFIEKIPPSPKILKQTLLLLNSGELLKAANIAKEDLALNAYLKELVNKPIYGFRNEINDISQIFGILGVSASQQAVYNYRISLLSPEKWKLFKLNKISFSNLQAELSANWQKILKHLDIKDRNIESSITLLPASIIVSEALFSSKMEDINLLRSAHPIDLNTILKRLCGMDLFDICEQISIKWDMDTNISEIVQAASGIKPTENQTINTLGKWMHLLVFFTLSQAHFVDAQLNDFIDFQVDYVEEIYSDFSELMEIS